MYLASSLTIFPHVIQEAEKETLKYCPKLLHFQNGNRRHKHLVLGHTKDVADFVNTLIPKTSYLMMTSDFLVYNMFLVFAGKVFQQPMGTDCTTFLADNFLHSYEAEGTLTFSVCISSHLNIPFLSKPFV